MIFIIKSKFDENYQNRENLKNNNMKKNLKQKVKKKNLQLERLLLDPIPQTPIPAPYFTISSPQNYRFPLGQTMLQGIKLLENYFPEDINDNIRSRLGIGNVEKMTRYNDVYCMLGKQGNGLIIGNDFMNLSQITAFSYGPNYLIIAFKDLRLDLYSLDLRLIKSFKKFFNRQVSFLKLLSIPKGYQNIVFLSHDNRDVYVHRLNKSLLSKFSSKLNKKIIENLEHLVTQMFQLPKYFRSYLRNDTDYKDTSLICISSINRIDIVRINHFRLDFDKFWDVVYTKKVEELGSNVVSWGQTKIQAPSRELKGQKLVLVCAFGSKLIFLALNEQLISTQNDEISTKYEWIESYPFTLKNTSQVAFCQFVKKNEFILITDQNNVLIFNTKNFDIFEKAISNDQFEIFTEKFDPKLSSRLVKTIQIRSQIKKAEQEIQKIKQQIPDLIVQLKRKKNTKKNGWSDSIQRSSEESQTENSQYQNQLSFFSQPEVTFKNIVTFADSFTYEYPSAQIYYLVQNEDINFGVYVYCDWKLISDLLRLDKKYEQCMLFLIAITKGANKFDLNVKNHQKQISSYVQELSIEFINQVIVKLKYQKELQENIENLLQIEQHFKIFIKPIEFLCETQQFSFLFQNLQQKLISSMMLDNVPYHKQYHICRKIFFTALIKFIEHGRIKYIPESHLQLVFDYYLENDRPDVIDRLAIYFDLEKIDTPTVVQCLLQNDLAVSLAHICIQGTQSLFVTPFVKFWGVSANYKYLNQMENATIYAIRALWYVKLCLQRNWALKQYSFERYAKLIGVLSHHFLSEKIIVALLEIRPQECLQTLNYYFNIQNSMIVNHEMQLNLKGISICDWIVKKNENQTVELLLSAINVFINKANLGTSAATALMNIFLSNIIIYRTVSLNEGKYYEIIISLIQKYRHIKQIKYGLDDKLLEEFQNQFSQFSEDQIDQILSSRYIIRIFTLVYYEKHDFIKNRLISIYQKSRQFNLMDLQAELCLFNGQYANAVEIYLRAKPNLRILIFQFLANSFKKLILEKKKNEKKRLGDNLTQKIKSLVELDSTKTKQIVDNYLPEIQQQLIQALSDNQQLQLQYLEQIVNGNDSIGNFRSRLSNPMILRYVQLMSKMKADELLESFKKHTYFPIDECIKICQEQQVYDCLQYLFEKSGASGQAVKIAMKRIDQILRIRMYQSQELLEENFTHYIKIKEILDHAIEVCKINRSEQTWQSLLDSSIQLYNKYLNSNFPEDEIEIFFYINGQIMEHLASNCQIQHTIDLLQNKYQNLNMGGKMTKAFITILANLSHSINIMFIAQNMIENTYQNLLTQDYFKKISGVGGQGTCRACNYGIMRRNKSKHFHCHHSYHNECVIHQTPAMCVYCLLHQSDQFQFHINSINSPMHPKLKKMQEIFVKFNTQSDQMCKILNIQDQEELNKKQDNVIITNVQKKKNKLQGFDQMMLDTEKGNRRVLRELRMY